MGARPVRTGPLLCMGAPGTVAPAGTPRGPGRAECPAEATGEPRVREPQKPSPRSLGRWLLRTAAAACLLLAAAAGAQPPPDTPPAGQAPQGPLIIGSIRVEGNVFTDSVRVLRTFEVQPGQEFVPDQIRRGLRKLFALGLYSDARVNQQQRPGEDVLDLVIVGRERPRIAGISVKSMKHRESADLEKKLFLKIGETYSARAVSNQIDSLLHYYREEGFSRAKVSSQTDTLAGRNEVNLRFLVDEGEKVKITGIRFTGMQPEFEARLRKAMKTKKKGFLGGGDIKDETFAEDKEKLEAWYHDHGYRDMRIADVALEPGATPRELTLHVTIEEGRFYQQGEVSWTGMKVVPSGLLERGWPRKGGPAYSRARIQQAVSSAYGEYAEQGYLYVGIEPREDVVQDSIVNVTFVVSEGAPSHIRRISITGNKGT